MIPTSPWKKSPWWNWNLNRAQNTRLFKNYFKNRLLPQSPFFMKIKQNNQYSFRCRRSPILQTLRSNLIWTLMAKPWSCRWLRCCKTLIKCLKINFTAQLSADHPRTWTRWWEVSWVLPREQITNESSACSNRFLLTRSTISQHHERWRLVRLLDSLSS